MSQHRVQFYDSDEFLMQKVLDFIEPARRRGDGIAVIADRDHLEAIRALLRLRPCESTNDCVLLDARDALATFMEDGMPNPQRFDQVIGGMMRHLSRDGRKPVSAYGEMVAVLCAEGNAQAAVQLERLWEQLAQRHRFDLLCAYPLSAFPNPAHRHAFDSICAAHSHVEPLERYATIKEPDELHRMMARLQQRANALDSELRQRQSTEQLLECQKAQIEALVATQAELEKLAGQDPLTGLANRRIFNDRLAHAVERAARTGNPLALIFIDIDNFKSLNDTHGHAAGDYLLKQVAARLSLCVRTADTVCRWGGDEFAVITENADDEQARLLKQRIVAALCDTFAVSDTTIHLSASVGISHFPCDATTPQALVERADAAMYRAKRSGDNHTGAAQSKPGQNTTAATGHLAAA